MTVNKNICFVIPNYNHGATQMALLMQLQRYNLACIIVDDGSDEATKIELTRIQQQLDWVEVITLAQNEGKGSAMQHGFARAIERGYTHALQIDADGQHCCDDVLAFIQTCEQHPDSLISGRPIYDDSIPKSRLYGRKITNFWVAVETWSLAIPEAMCGFRIYPLRPTLAIMQHTRIGKRMDFDTDILVRLYWAQVPILFIPTRVTYPAHGISHFRMWRDNVRLTQLHFRLFFGMLRQIPQLVRRKLK